MKIKVTNPNATVDQVVKDGEGTIVLTVPPSGFFTIEDADEEEEPPPEGTLAPAMDSWETAHAADRVPIGGPLTFISDSGVSGGGTSAGRTFADTTPAHLIRQHGQVNAFDYVPYAFGLDPNNWRFKMFRPDGTDLDQTGQGSVFTKPWPAPNPVQTLQHVLASPLACLPGDAPGVWLLNGNGVKASALGSCRYNSGDLATLISTDEATGFTIDIRPLGPSPFLAIIGDSIAAGHGTPFYRPFMDGGISGDPDGEPSRYLRDAIPNLTYQNFSCGSTGWAYCVTHVGKIAAVTPAAVLVHTGVNDLARSWSAVETDMNAFKAGLPSGCKLFVDEILPYTGGSDAANATIRAWNSNYATWCASNGAVLVPCHDEMGQLRTSTGHLDDLKTALDDDGVHPNGAGKAALAALWLGVLDAHAW